jgi:ABC-type sugar transport system substrate-binding protein
MKKLLAALLMLVIMGSLSGAVFAEKKYTIAGMISDGSMKAVIDGMKAAADKLGVALLISNTNNTSAKEVELLNAYIARGVDAICMAAPDAEYYVSQLKAANDKGIRVVLIDNEADADFTIATQTGQTALGGICGKAAAEYIKSALMNKTVIKVAVLKSSLAGKDPGVSSFLDQIKGDPRVKVVSQQTAWAIDTAIPKAGDILIANPDLDIAFSYDDGDTKGWVLAAQNAKKKPVVFGVDVDSKYALMLNSLLQAVYVRDSYQEGYMSIVLAAIALQIH